MLKPQFGIPESAIHCFKACSAFHIEKLQTKTKTLDQCLLLRSGEYIVYRVIAVPVDHKLCGFFSSFSTKENVA